MSNTLRNILLHDSPNKGDAVLLISQCITAFLRR